MKRIGWLFLLLVALFTAGCARITSQVVEKPRVDQDLQGNRGFLVGTPPAPAARKSTRKIVQTDIELPTPDEMNPWRAQKGSPEAAAPAPAPTAAVIPLSAPEPARSEPIPLEPSVESKWQEVAPVVSTPVKEEPTPATTATTYTVKAGDTLEKISAKLYGDSSQWRRIFRANQDRLKGPNRIYPGQKLVIPPAGHRAEHQTQKRTRSAEQFK